MYSRRVHAGVDVIWQGMRFKQISFITRGKISLRTRDGLCFFMQEPGTIFGDYQHIFGLQSNIIYRAEGEIVDDQAKRSETDAQVNYMAVKVDIWDRLCELYPKSKEAWKDFALLKREAILHYMEKGL